MGQVKNYLILMRPKQWIKNLFVLAALFFSGDINTGHILSTIVGLIAFSLMSSIVYILNDWRDIEADRQHTKKNTRPLALGIISPTEAGFVASIIATFLIAICVKFNFSPLSILLLIVYLAINIAYSYGLKHVPVLELMLLASGFVIRLIFGASIISVTLSSWIIVCTGLLSMMLAVGKRRGDLIQDNDSSLCRRSLRHYNLQYLDQINIILATATLTTYVIFCSSEYAINKFGNEVILSSPFVIYGILTYLRLLLVDSLGSDPTTLILSNRALKMALVGWFGAFTAIIYF